MDNTKKNNPEIEETPDTQLSHGESGEHKHDHSHHHHHSRHKQSRTRRKLRKFYEKHKKVLRLVMLVLILVVLTTALMGVANWVSRLDDEKEEKYQSAGVDGVVVLAAPVFDAPQSVAGDGAMAIWTAENTKTPASKILENYWSDTQRLDISKQVQLNFYVSKMPAGYSIEGYRVFLADNIAMEQAKEFSLPADAKTLSIANLKTDTEYFYQIQVVFTNGVTTAVSGSFRTEKSPRILTVEGIRNVRDIGGWTAEHGKTIRQGLLYRGTELDGAVVPEYKITDAGCQTMLVDFGIRTEMDLRWSGDVPQHINVLGSSVTHEFYGAPLYTGIFLPENQENVRRIFTTLADPAAYPVYMHCTYGLDRTGTICCILQAVLGVTEDDIRREYLLSGLHLLDLNEVAFDNLMDMLKEYPGNTLQEKAQNYLLTIGVTQQQIDSLKQIYLK